MNEFLEFYRLTTNLLAKLGYAVAAVICTILITERMRWNGKN